MQQDKIKVLQKRRRIRVRSSLRKRNALQRKRVVFKVSNRYLYAQLFDEKEGKTILTVTTLKDSKKAVKKNIESAKALAGEFVKAVEAKGFAKDEALIFDRGERLYHGRVKAFCDELREKGLNL